ncbi:hypothetical protein MHU86_22779 [Fragilaria crotonensis]|nr:hypothetical protein MHU86_22779 [Fragilaria crotonensis]
MLTFGHLATLANARQRNQFKTPRHLILELTALVGLLASSFLQHCPLDNLIAETSTTSTTPSTTIKTPPTSPNRKLRPTPPMSPSTKLWRPPVETRLLMGQILFQLAMTASSCRLDLRKCILAKLVLNEKKYPVELCKGKSGKYTAYSDQTGITKTVGQDTDVGVVLEDNDSSSGNDEDNNNQDNSENNNSGDTYQSPEHDKTEIDAIQMKISKFADDRLWNRFHTPRNLVLALIGELGELSELYQWKGEKEELNGAELEKVGQEIADVAIYLLRLATVCRVKIGEYTVEACANMTQK